MIHRAFVALLFAGMLGVWAFSMIIDPYQTWDETGTMLRPGVAQELAGGSALACLIAGLIAATLYSDKLFRRGKRLWLTAPILLFFFATALGRWAWMVLHVMQ